MNDTGPPVPQSLCDAAGPPGRHAFWCDSNELYRMLAHRLACRAK